MIVRDCGRMFDEMGWRPYDYVMNGEYRDENVSMHRTIKWSEFAGICRRLRGLYSERTSLEGLEFYFRCAAVAVCLRSGSGKPPRYRNNDVLGDVSRNHSRCGIYPAVIYTFPESP